MLDRLSLGLVVTVLQLLSLAEARSVVPSSRVRRSPEVADDRAMEGKFN